MERKEIFFLICILAIIFAIDVIIISHIPADKIYGDEVFYFHQALKIREGKFMNFQNTQPLLYPLFLSLFINASPFFLRLLNVFLLIISLVLLFYYSKRFSNLALLVVLVFGFNSLILLLTSTLYTEILFFVFLFLSFIVFENIKNSKKILPWIGFGIILGLACQTRVTGLILFMFFLFYILLKDKFQFHHFLCFLTMFLVLLPWFLVGGWNFLIEKQIGSYFDIVGPIKSILKYWWPLTPFLFFGFYTAIKQKKEDLNMILLFCLVCMVILISFTGVMFERHFSIVFPFLSIISIIGVEKIINKNYKKAIKIIVFVFLIFLLGFYIFFSFKNFKTPDQVYSQHFYLKIPDNCIEIKKWEVDGKMIELPVFDQQGEKIYSTTIKLDKNYSKIVLLYADDYGRLNINNTFFNFNDPFVPKVFKFDFVEGIWRIELMINNVINIGGIGQVLICQD